MAENRKTNKQNIIYIVIIISIFLLFKEFVWNKYIVNETAWDALEDVPGKSSTMHALDSRHNVVVSSTEQAFRVYFVTKKFLTWTIEEEVVIKNEPKDAPYSINQLKVPLKKYEDLELLYIASYNREIDTFKFTPYDESAEIYGSFNGTGNVEHAHGNYAYLHYTYAEEGFPKNLTFEAYDQDGELLYKE